MIDWQPKIHGVLLRHARLKEGLTRKDLAERLKVSELTVFNWETEKNSPQAKSLKAIVNEFGEDAFDPEKVVIEEEGPGALASWVAGKRIEKKWSRKELAQKAGVSEMTIWNIETGRTLSPQDGTIESIETALGEALPKDIGTEVSEQADLKVQGVGPFTNFDPHDEDHLPSVPGIYVFYDISDRAVYVGKAQDIGTRIRDRHTGHWDKFWYRSPIVFSGAFVRVDDEVLRNQIETVMIKFMKSNAVINKRGVAREEDA
jgi:transcriptional regulator with XRE-family HTH domain